MELHERVRYLRKDLLKMSQTEFAEILGTKRDVINNIEGARLKRPEQKEPLFNLICEKFDINEKWLKEGTGEIFKKKLPTDEVAEYVSNLLEYDGSGNPLYDIIISMMQSYVKLDDKSQAVIDNYLQDILDSLNKKRED